MRETTKAGNANGSDSASTPAIQGRLAAPRAGSTSRTTWWPSGVSWVPRVGEGVRRVEAVTMLHPDPAATAAGLDVQLQGDRQLGAEPAGQIGRSRRIPGQAAVVVAD